MRYGIGLDIGIASVGFATVALDEKEEPCGILRLGVRIFKVAEVPKSGASLAKPRRDTRGARRRLRRHRHRLERIRHLLVTAGLTTEKGLDSLYTGQLEDIYALRTRALDERVDNASLCRILIHLAQHRGFRSNRRADAGDAEAGKLLKAVKGNEERMQQGGYRTAGEMFLRDEAYTGHKRNRGGGYLSTVTRDMVEAEAALLCKTQRELGNGVCSEAFQVAYTGILLSQRSFDDGPGGNSPYAGSQFLKNVGRCALLPNEERAPKAAYSFEFFRLLQDVNHLRILGGGRERFLSPEERQTLLALAHTTPDLDYARIRKVLGLQPEERFNCVSYRDEATAVEKKKKPRWLAAYHAMRRVLERSGRTMDCLTVAQRNRVAYIFTVYQPEVNLRTALEAEGFGEELLAVLPDLPHFSGAGHISVKACDALIPYLEQGMSYDKACAAAGLAFKGHEGGEKTRFLPAWAEELKDITSPVARRAISQTIKVVNALIREQDTSPVFVHIELAREMAKTKTERDEIQAAQEKNAANNDLAMEELRQRFHLTSPSGQDLVKYKLYKEQDGVCLYSLQRFGLNRLFEPGYAEVDHIIPYSLCFDNGYRNKVLVFAEENRRKGNRLPLQYLTGQSREAFEVWVGTRVHDSKKRQRLLKREITDQDRSEWKERNLQDTKTMSRFLYNYMNDHLAFAPSATGRKKRVTAVNGNITSYLRSRWGLRKVREDGDMHHAMDAVVIACATDGLIQKISRYAQLREGMYTQEEGVSYRVHPATGEILDVFPHPWEGFRKELDARLSDQPALTLADAKLPGYAGLPLSEVRPLFVSHMPRHKGTGPAHDATLRSPRLQEEGLLVTKTPLAKLKLKDGEIDRYYDPDSDRLLYAALVQRLAAFGGNAAKAFAEPFYKPRHDGTPGLLVRTVKLTTAVSNPLPLQQGRAAAENGSMLRIDIFRVEGEGYCFVPVYAADAVKPVLPNKAATRNNLPSEWKEMRRENFLFSLYPGDLLHVRSKKEVEMVNLHKGSTREAKRKERGFLAYYVSAGIGSVTINVTNHDRTYGVSSMGIKTLSLLEKYEVDVLGNIRPAGREARQPLGRGRVWPGED